MDLGDALKRVTGAAVATAIVTTFCSVSGENETWADVPLEKVLLTSEESPVRFDESVNAPWTTSNGKTFWIKEGATVKSRCVHALKSGAKLNMPGHEWQAGKLAADEERVLPDHEGLIAVGVVETTDQTDGVDNPIAKYFGELGQVCDGQELASKEGWPYKGVSVSGHEFGTVEYTEAGELPSYYSAYAVPGYIILTGGWNVTLEQIRAVSAAQSKAVEESMWLTPQGQTSPWDTGFVNRLRQFWANRTA